MKLQQRPVQAAVPSEEAPPPAASTPEAPWYDGAVGDFEPERERLPADHAEAEPERETILAIMGGSVRKGEWEPPEVLRILALMGGVDLDFSEAVLLEGVSEVHIFALMGGVNIKVPTDINVEVRGIGIMGGFNELSQRLEDPDAPTLRVRGVALMGGVDVKVKKDKKKWFGGG